MKMKSEVELRSKSYLKQIVRTRKYRVRTAARVLRYGTQSFARNIWLTMAAIAIMTVTLLVIAGTLIVTSAMGTAIDIVKEQVDMSVYIKKTAERDKIDKIVAEMMELSSVNAVAVTSSEDAYKATVEGIIENENITNQDLIDAMYDAPNKLPWILNVKIADLNEPGELEYFVYNAEIMKDMLDAKPPSFSSSHRQTIDGIARTMKGFEIGGLIAVVVFTVIAILVVFNTIRMAIFNRKEEIYMMKLVGAEKSFIRGPFVVEATLYGLVAALIAAGIVFLLLSILGDRFGGTLRPTVDFVQQWWWLLLAGLISGGMLIGMLSSTLATRRYLKVS